MHRPRFHRLVLISLTALGVATFQTAPAGAAIRMMVTQSFQRTPVDPDPTHLPNRTQYMILESKYESSKGLEAKDVNGWYSGRCFFRDTPSHAVASLLAADTSSGSSANGPLFRGGDDRHITPLIDTTSAATAYDVIDAGESATISKTLAASRELNAFPVRSNEELVIAGHRTADLEARAYRLRRSGRFLFLKLQCAETTYCTNLNAWTSNNFLAYEHDAVAYCYYFKKVKP